MAFDLDDEENEATRIANGASRESRDKNINIEVGEYVRTINKGIRRIDSIDNNKTVNKYLYFTGIEDFEGKEYKIIKKTEIVKHSKQLIDLIEVGDIVNGYRVINVINEVPCPNGKCVDIDSSKDSSECTLWENDIQTILTKESYIANCYKVVGGEDEF